MTNHNNNEEEFFDADGNDIFQILLYHIFSFVRISKY